VALGVFAAAAAILLLVMGRPEHAADLPLCDAAGRCAPLAVGRWVEAAEGTRVRVADVGWLDVRAGSRLRVLGSHASQHRLELGRGELHAQVSAPPRLLIVETPAATAVDLGCEYVLTVDETGRTVLSVKLGYVALETSSSTRFVPAGARAESFPGGRLGIPAFEGSAIAEVLVRGELDAALAGATSRDTLSLWHLVAERPAGRLPWN
jgi:hypothetical protein